MEHLASVIVQTEWLAAAIPLSILDFIGTHFHLIPYCSATLLMSATYSFLVSVCIH